MSRKKKELPLVPDVEITAVASEGNSIAKINEKVVFIPYGAPGDIVDVKIDRSKHSYAEGHITTIKKPSPLRIEPKCSHYGVCGGCRWQHVPYDFQLEFKRQQVIDALTRIAKVEIPEVNQCLGSDNVWEYRNKMEYTFSNKKWLTYEQLNSGEEFPDRDCAGFHIPGAFDKVLDIEKCHLQVDVGNRIRNFIKNLGKEKGWNFYDLRGQNGFLRNIMLRTLSTGQIMLVMSVGENNQEKITELMNAIEKEFPEITSLNYVVNQKLNDTLNDLEIVPWNGSQPNVVEQMENIKYIIGPKSFYQTNSRQAFKLYSKVRELAGLKGNELVYDLYTGAGTIAIFISGACRKVIGIEYVEDAVIDARENAGLNNIDNVEFYAGDMKDVLTDEFIELHGRPEVMIIDPPRAGMHADVVKVVMNAAPQRIVYVSCNPSTQARDIALLAPDYKVKEVQPVDMFPHTHHVENIVLLERRK